MPELCENLVEQIKTNIVCRDSKFLIENNNEGLEIRDRRRCVNFIMPQFNIRDILLDAIN